MHYPRCIRVTRQPELFAPSVFSSAFIDADKPPAYGQQMCFSVARLPSLYNQRMYRVSAKHSPDLHAIQWPTAGYFCPVIQGSHHAIRNPGFPIACVDSLQTVIFVATGSMCCYFFYHYFPHWWMHRTFDHLKTYPPSHVPFSSNLMT